MLTPHRSLLKDSGATKAAIQDFTVWDDQLAISIAELNEQRAANFPHLTYSGASWADPKKRDAVAGLVTDSIQAHLEAKLMH